jgi:tripartite-type tricarboxylate transporter receptor subunit TctC
MARLPATRGSAAALPAISRLTMAARMRPITSVGPPAAKGTTIANLPCKAYHRKECWRSTRSARNLVIVAKKNFSANDLKGLVAWLKTNADKASAGTAGAGSPQRVSGLLFQSVTGTRFQFVPYRGAAPAMQDLLGGRSM